MYVEQVDFRTASASYWRACSQVNWTSSVSGLGISFMNYSICEIWMLITVPLLFVSESISKAEESDSSESD